MYTKFNSSHWRWQMHLPEQLFVKLKSVVFLAKLIVTSLRRGGNNMNLSEILGSLEDGSNSKNCVPITLRCISLDWCRVIYLIT